jgi:hypothetical protein
MDERDEQREDPEREPQVEAERVEDEDPDFEAHGPRPPERPAFDS